MALEFVCLSEYTLVFSLALLPPASILQNCLHLVSLTVFYKSFSNTLHVLVISDEVSGEAYLYPPYLAGSFRGKYFSDRYSVRTHT